MSLLALKIEFGGGLELLFSNQRNHVVTLPSHVPIDNRINLSGTSHNFHSTSVTEQKPVDIMYLIHHLRDHLLKEREELFMENDTVYVAFFHPYAILILTTDLQPSRHPCPDQRHRLGT